MIVRDTKSDRKILAVEDESNYRLLEVSDTDDYESDSYDMEVPVKWQIGYISEDDFDDRLDDRYRIVEE